MPCPCRPLCLVPKPGCKQPRLRLPAHRATGRTLADLVASLPMFEGLALQVIERLLADASALALPRNRTLFTAGSPADCFYILLEGQVKLFALTPDGRETIIEVFVPLTSFGEAAMLSRRTFPLHGEVIERATLIRVGRSAFVSALAADHGVAWRMLANLLRWNQRLASDLHRLRKMPAWRRVVEYLLALTDVPEGEAMVCLPFKKEVLASRVGIRRESLSRVLAKLPSLGVHTEGRAFRIDDVRQLRLFCAENGAEGAPSAYRRAAE